MGDEKIEVRANKIGDILGKEYYHTFIVYTDQKGTEYYLRGGPSGNPGSSGSSSELSGGSSGASGSSNSRRSSDSSSGQPYGPITTEYGNYTPGTIDWNPVALSVVVAHGNNLQAVYQQLQSQMNAIKAANIPYNPLNENSNAAVFTGLRNVGITPQLPNDIWAPGFGTQLIQPNGLRISLDAPTHSQTQHSDLINQTLTDNNGQQSTSTRPGAVAERIREQFAARHRELGLDTRAIDVAAAASPRDRSEISRVLSAHSQLAGAGNHLSAADGKVNSSLEQIQGNSSEDRVRGLSEAADQLIAELENLVREPERRAAELSRQASVSGEQLEYDA
jgi:hypothetical protein